MLRLRSKFRRRGAVRAVSRDEQARLALSLLIPAAMQGGFTEDELDKLPWFSDRDVIMTGGDLGGGIFRNLDLCPCHQCYSVVENTIPLAAVPAPAQVPGLLVYKPDPPPNDKCPDRCLHTKTHRWRGWYIERNTKTGAIELHCCSFAQYHCVLPDDPEGRRRPKEGPPAPDKPET